MQQHKTTFVSNNLFNFVYFYFSNIIIYIVFFYIFLSRGIVFENLMIKWWNA